MPRFDRIDKGVQAFTRKRTINPEMQEKSYEEFFERAFSEQDIEEILSQGGGIDIQNLKKASKNNIDSRGHFEAMFSGKQKLGKKIFSKFFEDGQISQNRVDRIIVRKGETINFSGKIYKGGQFVPRAYFKKR